MRRSPRPIEPRPRVSELQPPIPETQSWPQKFVIRELFPEYIRQMQEHAQQQRTEQADRFISDTGALEVLQPQRAAAEVTEGDFIRTLTWLEAQASGAEFLMSSHLADVITRLCQLFPDRRSELLQQLETMSATYPENDDFALMMHWGNPGQECWADDGARAVATAVLHAGKPEWKQPPEYVWEEGLRAAQWYFERRSEHVDNLLGVATCTANLRLLFPDRRQQLPLTADDYAEVAAMFVGPNMNLDWAVTLATISADEVHITDQGEIAVTTNSPQVSTTALNQPGLPPRNAS